MADELKMWFVIPHNICSLCILLLRISAVLLSVGRIFCPVHAAGKYIQSRLMDTRLESVTAAPLLYPADFLRVVDGHL